MAVVVSFVGKWDGKDVARAQKEIGQFADQSQSKFGKFAKRAGVALAAVGAAAVGAGVIFAKQAISAAEEAATAQARLDQVAQSMGFVGGAYDGATQRLQDYASELSKQVAIEDETILAVQAKLATFREVGKTMDQAGGAMDRATAAAVDLAAAGFGSAESNATQLGKALNDPIKGISALNRAGVTFTEQEKEKIKALVESGKIAKAQDMILGALEKQVGGVAAATANASDKMRVGFGELQESVGMALLPAFNELVDTLLPIFEDLQGPLSEIAATIGGVLGDALKALTPVLKPLATAFASIAGVLSGVLVTALSAIIPPLTPILTLLGDLAQRIAPLLEKLLGRLAEIFVKVADAVVPLLEPLVNLVFEILEAAWPIIDIVADVLLLLVDALKPLLAAVGVLIKPLGDLIKMGLAVILPIIRPLIPVIEVLAVVLSDILGRAIGLTMAGIGGLIVAFSKVAPFVINNVTKPVVAAFLTFAENIVGLAERAFSWVPGLGDKLGEAKTAIGKFKTDTEKSLGTAADTISKEGARIGQGLIDQGTNALTNPSSLNAMEKAGYKAGSELPAGLTRGMTDPRNTAPVAAAARQSIRIAEAAARTEAKSQSPSRLFADLGKDLTAGLAEGVKSGGDEIRKALAENFQKWFKESVDKLKGELDKAKQAFDNFKTTVASAITGAIDFSAAAPTFDEQGNRVGLTFIEALAKQAERAKEFATKVKELIASNLSQEALQLVLKAGVDAGTRIANELIEGGATAINDTNRLVQETQTAADEVGLLAAQNFYGAGVQSAQKTLEGFKANFGKGGPARAALMGIMDNLAAAAARDVKIDVAVTRSINEVVTRVVQSINAPNVKARAMGGPVQSGSPYLIGEKGPELFVPDVSGYVVSNADLRAGDGAAIGKAGTTINLTVNAGIGASGPEVGRQIVDVLKQYERRNGPVYVSA
jgi:phage-related protein